MQHPQSVGVCGKEDSRLVIQKLVVGPQGPEELVESRILPEGRSACRDAGMDGFLLKPVDPVRLEEMFSAMFPSGSGVSHTEAA